MSDMQVGRIVGKAAPERRRSSRAKRASLGLGGLAVSIIVASCGSSPSTHTASGPSSHAASHSASAHTAKRAVISTAHDRTFGTILVSGTPLYTLKPSKTSCAAECLTIWPPVLLPRGMKAASAGRGVNSSKLGTVATANGARQVTYSGRALYRFVKDKAPGQVNGNITDTWGKWSVVVVAGAKHPKTTTAPKSGGAGF